MPAPASRPALVVGKFSVPLVLIVLIGIERDVLQPLGDPKKTPDFYQLVALQHGHLSRKGDKNLSTTMAEINGVALSTAQGWITKARERGLLPPGRRGRAG